MAEEYTYRIEKEIEVMAYLQNLKYALDHGAKIAFQEKRKVDENRDERFTNTYTMGKLFPNENPVDALRRELKTLIDLNNPKLETMMLDYLTSEDDTLLTDQGIKTLNAYSRRGARLYQEFFPDKPITREEFLAGFDMVMQMYCR